MSEAFGIKKKNVVLEYYTTSQCLERRPERLRRRRNGPNGLEVLYLPSHICRGRDEGGESADRELKLTCNLVLTTQRWTKLVAGRGIPFSDGDFCAARRRHKMDQLRPATNIRSRERQLDCCESALPQWCAVSLCRPVCLVPLSRGKPLRLTANPPRAVLQCARHLTLLLSITP